MSELKEMSRVPAIRTLPGLDAPWRLKVIMGCLARGWNTSGSEIVIMPNVVSLSVSLQQHKRADGANVQRSEQ